MKPPRSAAVRVLVAALALASAAASCGGGPATTPTATPGTAGTGGAANGAEKSAEEGAGANAVVTGVVDGDTIDASFDGVTDRVRLLGIDTPESAIPDEEPECFGPEASRRLAELVPVGTSVRVERDVEARDRFARLLGYVYRAGDGLFVNAALVREGYAETLSIEPNTTHRSTFSAAASAARADGRGLWDACR